MHSTIPTLWSGTNSSCVSVFVLSIPARTNQGDQKQMITGQLAKEIQMKHRAPIVGISIFDHVRNENLLVGSSIIIEFLLL